jgi:putative transposase
MSRPHRLPFSACAGGHRHFLTICTKDRRDHFSDPSVVALTVAQFLQTATVESFEILAYCFMPDHLHAVAEGLTANADLRRFVRLAKQRTGCLFARAHRERLWQESFLDRTLRREDALADVIRYVINNPVRAGLVETPADYPYWGSQAYSREQILEFIQEFNPCRV